MPRVVIACQGGGSHTAFTAGVLKRLLGSAELADYEIAGMSGTSGGAVCALLAWYALRDGDPARAGRLLEQFWTENSASTPVDMLINNWVLWALYQELAFIEKIDQLLETGQLDKGQKYKQVVIRVIELSRGRLPRGLGSASKLNRDPRFIKDLMSHGGEQAGEFIAALSFERAWLSQDVAAVLELFAEDPEIVGAPPFSPLRSYNGSEQVRRFVQRQFSRGVRMDLTHKHVARERVTWTIRARGDGQQDDLHGYAEAEFRSGKVARLRIAAA